MTTPEHTTISERVLPDWDAVQIEFADVPGRAGIESRREAYAPFFLRMGTGVQISEGCRFSHPERIVLDDDARVNCGALIYGSGGVWIGRHARIGPRVFIHSANHTISPSERAFFEREYVYDKVVIGDCCLLSANVSILPGAELAPGCFVACGAVVTKGVYPDGSRIMGVPGRATVPEKELYAQSPSVALLTPATGAYGRVADLLALSVGLPQVCVYRDGEYLPRSIHTALLVGPSGWEPRDLPGLRIWRLQDGDLELNDDVSITFPSESSTPSEVRIASKRGRKLAPAQDPSRSGVDNAISLGIYYTLKRFQKRACHLVEAERLDLYLSIFMLAKWDDPRAEEVLGYFVDLLPESSDAFTARERSLCEMLSQPEAGCQAGLLVEVLVELLHSSDSVRRAMFGEKVNPYSDRTLLSCPELLPVMVFRHGEQEEALAEVLARLIPEASKVSHFIHFGIAAALLGRDDFLLECLRALYSDEYFDSQAQMIRSSSNSSAYCYSPSLAALLILGTRVLGVSPDFRLPHTQEIRFGWRVFGAKCSELGIGTGESRGSLIDADRCLVSRSLLENWLKSAQVPAMDGLQYELSEDDYLPFAASLELVWTKVFRHMQHSAGQPLVRVLPWPWPYKSALSIRYDIDRSLSSERVHEIIRMHASLLNGACGSWYAIPGTPFGDRLSKFLPRLLQEVGVHALSDEDGVSGQAVTHHSAPNSRYWRGQSTIEFIERGGALSGEMLAGQLSKPRPAWIGDLDDGRASSVWLMPIHFPLEGSTEENGLGYFDRRRDNFRQLLDDGGHVIVGCHPDLDIGLLKQLLEREELGGAWRATVGDVVTRCQRLNSISIANIEGPEGDRVAVVSEHTLADVQIEIDCPQDGVRTVCMQLNVGVPRAILQVSDSALSQSIDD